MNLHKERKRRPKGSNKRKLTISTKQKYLLQPPFSTEGAKTNRMHYFIHLLSEDKENHKSQCKRKQEERGGDGNARRVDCFIGGARVSSN